MRSNLGEKVTDLSLPLSYIYPTRCLANTPTVLSLVYRPNEAERKFNVLILIEERKSYITTCDSCHKPALDLHDCEHCQDRICSSCYQNHYDKVVALLTESINSISKIRVVFEKIQSKLVKTSSCYSDLEAAIDNASNGLKDACGKTLASAVSQLDESISEYLEGLDRKKGAIANLKTSIQKSFARFDEINKMPMGGLLQFCSELKNLSSLEEDISLTFKDVHEEQNPLGVELSKSYSSLTYLLQSHSLLEEHQGDLSRRSSSKNPVVEEPPKLIPDQKKVFVGGILPSTTKSTVESALSQLGPIKLLNVLSQRGFAVVLFEHPETADLALSTHWYTIDGKRVELRPFVPKKDEKKSDHLTNILSASSSSQSLVNVINTPDSKPLSPTTSSESMLDLRTIFVGGISAKTTEDTIRSSVSRFGQIEKVVISSTEGYATVTFESLDSATAATATHWLSINDKKVELLPYEPGKKKKKKRRNKQKPQSILPEPSFSSISETQESDDQSAEDISKRKLYVEGIETPISEVVLKLYFTRFGAIESCEITGQRACLIFECSKSVEAVLKASPHRLLDHDLKIVPPLSESTRPSQPTADMCMEGINNRKLFIKGLDEGVTYYILREYFSNYGPVKYASVDGTDAWIVFGNAETANLVLNSQPHFIRGRQVSLHRPDVANSRQTGCPASQPGIGNNSPLVVPCLGPLFPPNLKPCVESPLAKSVPSKGVNSGFLAKPEKQYYT
ncbi:hypothetical protein Aperf_G00000025875 [Anoplocephala perfoliata]